jgi:ribosomal protein S18 acetylase RimI-like enzyme
VIGYAYGRLEPRDWSSLRDRCGVGIDLSVDPAARGRGAGRLLAEALSRALFAKGAPRVVLFAAAKNRPAQRFFRSLGFRPTMVEMALERDKAPAGGRRSGQRAAGRRS